MREGRWIDAIEESSSPLRICDSNLKMTPGLQVRACSSPVI